VNYLFELYKQAEREGKVLPFLRKFSTYDILILDDCYFPHHRHHSTST
jgi:DNA replication protein DnaC